MSLPVVVDSVVLDYEDAARDLHELAGVARRDGWAEWSVELEGLAGIAERAAKGEASNPEPGPRCCLTCGGVRRCDIAGHVSRMQA